MSSPQQGEPGPGETRARNITQDSGLYPRLDVEDLAHGVETSESDESLRTYRGLSKPPSALKLKASLAIFMVVVVTAISGLAFMLGQRIPILIASGSVAALLLSFLFVQFYLGPLSRFTEKTLLRLQDLNQTLEDRVERRTKALRETNGQLQDSMDSLRSAQRQLALASRRAGMADVATAVLHNVGNVLNSVNVSAHVLQDGVRNSKASGIGRAAELLARNQANLAEFLTADAQGKRLPSYLNALATAVQDERSTLLREVASLQKNVDYIKTIIASQQGHATMTVGLVETFRLDEVLEEALAATRVTLAKYSIEVDRQFESACTVELDRHKLFQIVMNLITNARQAMQDRSGDKLMRVGVSSSEDRFKIEIVDNGAGIRKEDLGKIFTLGYTTKIDGHGFGLHASALAASDMGGSLRAESDGEGKGARFVIDLPL